MSQGARIAIAVLALLLTLGAIVGSLPGTVRSDTHGGPSLQATLERVARAEAHVEALAITAGVAAEGAGSAVNALSQRAQREIVETIAMIAEADTPVLDDVDALLISLLESVQRLSSGAATGSPRQLETLISALAAERDAVVSLQTDALSPAPGVAVQWALSAGAIVLGVVLVLVVVFAGRTRAAGDAALDTSPGSPRAEIDPRTGSAGHHERAGARGPSAGERDGGADRRRGRAAPQGASGGAYSPLASQSILNADQFRRVLERECERSSRYSNSLAAVVLTVDQAQAIRAAHGADALEYVVGSIAELSDDNTRGSDTVGIVAEHRIVVLLPETDVASAERVADKLSRNVTLFPFSDGIHATVSSGCVDALRDPDHLISNADT